MKEFKLIESEVAEYFRTARERYRIMLRRKADQCKGVPKLGWSPDPIFQKWFFCNVFREDDKTTRYIKKWIREPHRDDPCVFWMMVACRLFNKIETLEILINEGLFRGPGWNRKRAEKLLWNVAPLTGAAYMVHTPYGMNKLQGCLKLIADAVKDNDRRISLIEPGKTTLKEVFEMLLPADCFGPFMAYEVVTDLRHTYLLENAPDIMTWSSPGPGACLGLSRLVGEKVSYGSREHREAALVCMRQILDMSCDGRNWPAWHGSFRSWDMRTVEHWLCEHAKYTNAAIHGKRLKRKYGDSAKV
jgi:hypothetical protein